MLYFSIIGNRIVENKCRKISLKFQISKESNYKPNKLHCIIFQLLELEFQKKECQKYSRGNHLEKNLISPRRHLPFNRGFSFFSVFAIFARHGTHARSVSFELLNGQMKRAPFGWENQWNFYRWLAPKPTTRSPSPPGTCVVSHSRLRWIINSRRTRS